MIVFKSLKYKNFLSTGDYFTSIDLLKSPTTLIVGHNGSGKSTILDAISFGLFGKPHRDINKPQLVNSINNRDCIVEVEFSVGPTAFRIVRGLKPGIFEIYQNGILINQESHSRDYQKILEQNILKLNHKSFHQIVVLGSSSFIPFMQLPNNARREVIEDLLDINIFTKMNIVLKERSAKLRELLTNTNYEIDLIREKIKMQEKYIGDLKNLDAENVAKNVIQIQELQKEIDELISENDGINKTIGTNLDTVKKESLRLTNTKNKLATYQTQIEAKIKALVRDAKFYEENNNCPTCSQVLNAAFKEEKLGKVKLKNDELSQARNDLINELNTVSNGINATAEKLNDYSKLNNIILSNNMTVSSIQKQIKLLEAESAKSKNTDIASAETALSTLNSNSGELNDRRAGYYEEGTYNQAISEMLKDTGIKTKVIRQYLPVMNKLINGYLQVLDFFVSFNLDEAFNETIRSRHRDDFSYASFSEGEKQRIDLALLFTWRQIARMKNSISTNLLILDETFDSSMDSDGVENLIKILKTLEDNTNVFIISHKTDALDGKFSAKLEFYKEKNFSHCK
jgi:DNA repair exonuclease SbcCD ATPase subunit